jgi:hypothetical protein
MPMSEAKKAEIKKKQRGAIGSLVGNLDPESGVASLWRTDPDKFVRILGFQQTHEKAKDKSIEQEWKDLAKDINPFDAFEKAVSGTKKEFVTDPRRKAGKEGFAAVVQQERERSAEIGEERRRRAKGRTRGVGGRSPFTSYGVSKELLG